MPIDHLPLTYDECRARFRRAVTVAGLDLAPHTIAARGRDGQDLTIDVVQIGAPAPRRALIVQSGVHGVEGFIGSTLQTDLVARIDPDSLPPDMAILLIHAVNPWGMSWWRRQNESNVDLNRNWQRSAGDPIQNDAYDELHPFACPDTPTLPSVDELLVQAMTMVEERGMTWVKDGITKGQYRHADGLHFGGDRTEESCRILEHLVPERLGSAEQVLTIDLHTGHGPNGEVTFLSDQPPGSALDQFLHASFPGFRIEATADNPDATTGEKSGQIANSYASVLPNASCVASSVEFGTAPDTEQLAATYLESWVHRHGDPANPEHAAVTWNYRCCFTPDDSAWETVSLRDGRILLDQAVAAVATG